MFKEFGIQNVDSIFSLLKGKKVRVYASNYTVPELKYEGIVTSFALGLGEEFALLVIDDKTIVNTKYIVSIEILS